MGIRRVLLLSILAMSLPACKTATPSPVSVAGNWSGALSACANDWSCTLSFDLQVNSNKLSGAWSSENNPSVRGTLTGTIAGSASGSTVTMTLTPSVTADCSYSITATARNTSSMSGTFTGTNCPANPSLRGDFEASRQ